MTTTTTTTTTLTALDFRRLLRVEANLADLHDVLHLVLNACRKESELPGVPALVDLLERFAEELDQHHPADVLLPRPIDANRAGANDTINLGAEVTLDPRD